MVTIRLYRLGRLMPNLKATTLGKSHGFDDKLTQRPPTEGIFSE